MKSIILMVLISLTAGFICAEENNEVVGWRHNWHGTFPDANPPTDFTTEKNVIWKTKTESWSNASPVIVGDRIFITEEPYTLTCLALTDGKVVWRAENKFEDIFTPEEMKEYEKIQILIKQDKKEFVNLNSALRAAQKKLRADRGNKELQEEAQKAEEKIKTAMAEFAEKYSRYLITGTQPTVGYSTPTPVSDGKNIYAVFGNDVICSYDFAGNRRWAIRAGNATQTRHHSCRSASPVIADNKLIVHVDAANIYAFDLDTGKQLWSCPAENEFCSPAAAVFDGLPVVIAAWKGLIIDARNGSLLGSAKDMSSRVSTPVLVNDILYVGERGRIDGVRVYRLSRVKTADKDSIQADFIWECKASQPLQENYASPLVYEGLMYRCSTQGILNVRDAATGESTYEKKLDLRKHIYTSLTLIGDNVFVADEKGRICIFKKGDEFKEVAYIDFEPFRSNPVALGDRLYIRGLEHIYCIGKK